jgi:hypothetical protein
MVGDISRGVLDHPNSNISHFERSPICPTRLTSVLGLRNLRPVRGGEADVFNLQMVLAFTADSTNRNRKRKAPSNFGARRP